MKKDKVKGKFVGVRMTEDQASVLDDIQKSSNLTKTEILLRGLDFLREFSNLKLNQSPMSEDLKNLENEAIRYAAELKRVRRKEEAIMDMVKELRDIDEIIDQNGCNEGSLIQILLDIQAKYNWLPKHSLLWVSERLNVPMARILQITTFYKAFSLEPRGKHLIRICTGTACHVRNSSKIMERTETLLGIKAGETTSDGLFSLDGVNCLGCCALGPVIVVDGNYHGKLEPSMIENILSTYK